MKQIVTTKKLPLLLLATLIVMTVAFAQTTSVDQKHVATDTIPAKEKKIRNLDEALSEIEHGELELARSFSEIDREEMEREIRNAMKNMKVDMAKMKEDMAKAMKEMEKQKIHLEVDKELEAIDAEKMKAEMKASLSKIDLEKMKKELEKVKELDFSKMQAELANIQPQVEKAMKEAKKSLEAARVEFTTYKNLVNALDKDGLLNKTEAYQVEYRNKELTVNGKKISAEAAKKYHEFLSGKEDFTLQKSGDGIELNK